MPVSSTESKTTDENRFPVCSHCASTRVLRDAWAKWDEKAREWGLDAVFDQAYCPDCDGETSIDWVTSLPSSGERIRRLNDRYRINGIGNGKTMITAGVRAQGETFVAGCLNAVRSFSSFDTGNDPHGEHDFGAVTIAGERVFFKIDYYDHALEAGSPDPADPSVTTRVMTVMLAEEY